LTNVCPELAKATFQQIDVAPLDPKLKARIVAERLQKIRKIAAQPEKHSRARIVDELTFMLDVFTNAQARANGQFGELEKMINVLVEANGGLAIDVEQLKAEIAAKPIVTATESDLRDLLRGGKA
jgi:hypothetical protein